MKIHEVVIRPGTSLEQAAALASKITDADVLVLVAFKDDKGAVVVHGPQELVMKLPMMLRDLADRVEGDQGTGITH